MLLLGLLLLDALAEIGHIFFYFLHDAHLHLDLHVSLLLAEILLVLVLAIYQVVFPYLGFSLLAQALDLGLLFGTHSHHTADCLADGATIVLCLLFQDADDFWPGEDKAYFLHEVGP